MKQLFIDIETYSEINLQKAGLYKYVQNPSFEILLFAYAFDSEPVNIIDLTNTPLPSNLISALHNPSVIKLAYNAAFEWYCINKFFHSPLDQWQCIMAHGLYCGYPGKLAQLGEALGLPQDKRKMSVGASLIRTFCIPCKPTKMNGNRTRTLPQHEPEKWELFKTYCKTDVITEIEAENRLTKFPLPEAEQYLWQLDVLMNMNGVAVDTELIGKALQVNEIITNELMAEAINISGLNNPKSVKQLTEWLNEELEEEVTNLQKNTVADLLNTVTSDKAKRMLEIRQELAKTSIRKYAAMREAVCADGRIRGLIQYYGANRTGRYAGRLVQIHNLPQNHLPALETARNLLKRGDINALKLIYGNIPDTLSQLIRTAFIPKPGYVLAVADFSAIEARIVAWYARERWRLDVFAGHGKIYEASASAMFGIPIEQIDKALRQKGKIAELALGYQGSVGALITMGALRMGLTEEELPEIVSKWRAANKRIVDFWYMIDRAVVDVIKTGQPIGVNGLMIALEGDYENKLSFLTIRLPSGRKLYYVNPHLEPGMNNRDIIFYWGLNQETKKWERIQTYGGKLTENIVQATARDCLVTSICKLQNYNIVFHVHDEIVMELPENQADIKTICTIMGEPIPWAPGLPMKAEGFITKFYTKEG